MEDTSVFRDKGLMPADQDLMDHLGDTFPLWKQIEGFVFSKYPTGEAAWNFPGQKYGWSFRIRDKKRVIIYLLPREKYFKVAFVFGQKATDEILNSDIAEDIRRALEEAPKYAEGRGIRIDIMDDTRIADIFKLTEIKLAY